MHKACHCITGTSHQPTPTPSAATAVCVVTGGWKLEVFSAQTHRGHEGQGPRCKWIALAPAYPLLPLIVDPMVPPREAEVPVPVCLPCFRALLIVNTRCVPAHRTAGSSGPNRLSTRGTHPTHHRRLCHRPHLEHSRASHFWASA
jgi:hypothetical protein